MADTDLELRALGVNAVRTAEVEQNVIAAAEARAAGAAAGPAAGTDAVANGGAVPDGGAPDAGEAESAEVVRSLCGSSCFLPTTL